MGLIGSLTIILYAVYMAFTLLVFVSSYFLLRYFLRQTESLVTMIATALVSLGYLASLWWFNSVARIFKEIRFDADAGLRVPSSASDLTAFDFAFLLLCLLLLGLEYHIAFRARATATRR